MKCLAFHLLRFAPRTAYTFLQRYVTNRYFAALTPDVIEVYAYHVRNFRGGLALELGAGTNLASALLLSAAGAEEVLAYDIARIATVEQVNHAIRQLRVRPGYDWPEIDNLGDSLQRLYRIRYCAPADARDTRLPPQSVDFICSTSTLEHIAPKDIQAILVECRRIASPRAVMSFIVDYHDHYASADPTITRANFYRYSEADWRFYNPANHFQNRLRHSDYLRLFHGMEAIDVRAVIPQQPTRLPRMHPRFSRYSYEDLQALNGFFCLRAHAANK